MNTLQLISALVAAAAVFGWVSSRWLKLPLTIGIMIMTVATSLLLAGFAAYVPVLGPALQHGVLRMVQQIDFEQLILHGMLSLLLFAGAFLLDFKFLMQEKLVVSLLSVAGTILSTITVAMLMHLGLPWLGLRVEWLPCLFFGALISPTDPIAVLEMLRRVGAPANLQAQLAGESLFNDGVGAVIFVTVLAVSRGAVMSPDQAASHLGRTLLLQVGGAAAIAVALAWVTSALMLAVEAYQVEILLTLSLALGGYALADKLHFSAPLEAVIAGIALRRFNLSHAPARIAHESIDRFWEVIDEVQNAVLFVLLGLEVLAIPFQRLYLLSGLLAVIVVTASRFGIIALLIGTLDLCRRQRSFTITALTWGGLRGGLAIALALAVPHGAGREWILATTYIVVVVSIVVQGGSMDLFLKRYRRAAQPEYGFAYPEAGVALAELPE